MCYALVMQSHCAVLVVLPVVGLVFTAVMQQVNTWNCNGCISVVTGADELSSLHNDTAPGERACCRTEQTGGKTHPHDGIAASQAMTTLLVMHKGVGLLQCWVVGPGHM